MKIKRTLKKLSVCILVIFIILSLGKVYAETNLNDVLSMTEYSDEYKEWLKLSDEEKENVMQPKKYKHEKEDSSTQDVKKMNNLLKATNILQASVVNKYDLRDVIPENVAIKNQMKTSSCWIFASLGALESNLAMMDKANSSTTTKVYDFSERHMQYATTKTGFTNNQTNDMGYSKELTDGGNFYMAMSYLTNGSGAIPEDEMKFENNMDKIDISEIQNKTVVTTVYDVKDFSVPTTDAEKQQLIIEMKAYIQKYGGIYAGIHGDKLVGSDPHNNYNNATGAIYCPDASLTPADHAVVIIGWDDNYSKANFNSKNQPQNDGAWIVKNSWGVEMDIGTLADYKTTTYNSYTEECNQRGWNSAEEIDDEFVISVLESIWGEGKISTQDGNVKAIVGDQGYMYISYEDAIIYSTLFGITKATPTKDYDNIYQNDILGMSYEFTVDSEEKLYLANVYTRTTTEEEYIDRISIEAFSEDEYKVYINPNGSSKAPEDLKQVELTSGTTAKCNAGYSSIEFAEPIKITGNSFAIVLESQDTSNAKHFGLEMPRNEDEGKVKGYFKDVAVNVGESFFTLGNYFESNTWADFVDTDYPGNLCIKAYTTKNASEIVTLDSIYIINPPTKTIYKEGETLDLSGGTIKAKYSDGTEKIIDMKNSDMDVSGFDSSTIGTKTITITYKEKNATFTVDVVNKDEETPNNPQNKKEPIASNFKESIAQITDAEIHMYTINADDSYIKMKIKVTNIKLGDEEDKYSYYYYLSGTKGDKNIPDTNWKEAETEKQSDGTYSLIININTKEMENINEISNSENLYLYIKEIAEINDKKLETINTLEIENNSDPVIYLDNNKVGSIEELLGQIKAEGKDPTTAPGTIPQTGKLPIIILIFAVLTIGGFSLYRYKNIDR